MSLEIAIQENTKALNALIAMLGNMGTLPAAAPAATPAATPAVEIVKPDVVKTEPAKKKAEVKAEVKTEPAPAAEPAPVQEPAKAEIKYDDLKNAVLKLAVKDRNAVLSILTGYGVKTAQNLKPEQYAECLEKVNVALAGAQ